MSTEVLLFMTIDPIRLSILEEQSGTALIGFLMRLDLFVTAGRYCQLLQRLP